MSSRISRCLVCALPILAACASREPATRSPEGRDYYSVNRSSLAFLHDTIAREPREARKSFRSNWNWSEIREDNKRIRRDSIRFLGTSLVALECESAKQAWTVDLPRELLDRKDPHIGFWGSVRFGFLDSGD